VLAVLDLPVLAEPLVDLGAQEEAGVVAVLERSSNLDRVYGVDGPTRVRLARWRRLPVTAWPGTTIRPSFLMVA
jgi:hypothetical protein